MINVTRRPRSLRASHLTAADRGRGSGSEQPSQPASASLSGTAATKIAPDEQGSGATGNGEGRKKFETWELQTSPER